ncbi:MAG: heliorhodopsin HeR [Acidimicrobiia bacterium]|nr:heliorhodopsin HeR [Acidimicrobiia bacterium]
MTALVSTVSVSDREFGRLRTYNWIMGGLHAIQGLLILVLATDFTLPVTASFLQGPPGTSETESVVLFDLSVAGGVAAFLFLSALFHFIIASVGAGRYRDQLARGQNQFRWIEYALSSSLMIVLIAMLPGITDVAALVALFGVNAGMIFFGSVQERYEEPGGSLWPFWLGVVLGGVPWVAIGIYLVSPGSNAQPPAFVYAIFVSLFVFFNTFALTQLLQYRQVGRFRNYLTGERTYILLSLLAKTALAWQVFAGTLVPT